MIRLGLARLGIVYIFGLQQHVFFLHSYYSVYIGIQSIQHHSVSWHIGIFFPALVRVSCRHRGVRCRTLQKRRNELKYHDWFNFSTCSCITAWMGIRFFATVVNSFLSSSTQRIKHARGTPKRRDEEVHWFRGSTPSLWLRIDNDVELGFPHFHIRI